MSRDCCCSYQLRSEHLNHARNHSSAFILAQTKETKKVFPKMPFEAQSAVTKCSRMALGLWQIFHTEKNCSFSEAAGKSSKCHPTKNKRGLVLSHVAIRGEMYVQFQITQHLLTRAMICSPKCEFLRPGTNTSVSGLLYLG